MVDASRGWAVLNDVYYTQDGGLGWENVNPAPQLKNDTIRSVGTTFLDGSHSWIMGATINDAGYKGGYSSIAVWRTSDSGHTWQKTAESIPAVGFIAASFSDPIHGWLLVADRAYQNSENDILIQTIDCGVLAASRR